MMWPVLTPTSQPLTPEQRHLYNLIGAACDQLNALDMDDPALQGRARCALNARLFAYLGFQLREDDHVPD